MGNDFLAAQVHGGRIAHGFYHACPGDAAFFHQLLQAHIKDVVAVGGAIGGVGVRSPPVTGRAVVPAGQVATFRIALLGMRLLGQEAVPVVLAVAPAGQFRVDAVGTLGVVAGMEEGDIPVVDIEPVEAARGVVEHVVETLHIVHLIAGGLHEGQRGIQFSKVGAALAGHCHGQAGHGGKANHRAVLLGADHAALDGFVLSDCLRVGGGGQVPAGHPFFVDHIEGFALAVDLVAAFTVGGGFGR